MQKREHLCTTGENVNWYSHSIEVPQKMKTGDFLGGLVVKNPSANAGDRGSIPGPGRSHIQRSN